MTQTCQRSAPTARASPSAAAGATWCRGTVGVAISRSTSGRQERSLLVSHAEGSSTTGGNNYSHSPSLSADGSRVAFRSSANNLVAGLHRQQLPDLCLGGRDGDDGLARCGLGNGGATCSSDRQGSALTARASRSTAVPQPGGGVQWKRLLPSLRLGGGGRHAGLARRELEHDRRKRPEVTPSLSADGSRVAFTSSASDLVAGYSGGDYQVYVWEAGTVTVGLARRGSATTGANCYTTVADQRRRHADRLQSCASNLMSVMWRRLPGLVGVGRLVAAVARSANPTRQERAIASRWDQRRREYGGLQQPGQQPGLW